MIGIQNYSNQLHFQVKAQNQQRPQSNCQPQASLNSSQEISFSGRENILGKSYGGLKGLLKKIQKPCQNFCARLDEGCERELPTAKQAAKQQLIREAHHRDMPPGSTPEQLKAHDEGVEKFYRNYNRRNK